MDKNIWSDWYKMHDEREEWWTQPKHWLEFEYSKRRSKHRALKVHITTILVLLVLMDIILTVKIILNNT